MPGVYYNGVQFNIDDHYSVNYKSIIQNQIIHGGLYIYLFKDGG